MRTFIAEYIRRLDCLLLTIAVASSFFSLLCFGNHLTRARTFTTLPAGKTFIFTLISSRGAHESPGCTLITVRSGIVYIEKHDVYDKN